MRYLQFFEIALLIILALVVITQIVVPAILGTRMFPRFRREAKLRDEIAEANQTLREKDLEEVLRDRQEEAVQPRPTTEETSQ